MGQNPAWESLKAKSDISNFISDAYIAFYPKYRINFMPTIWGITHH